MKTLHAALLAAVLLPSLASAADAPQPPAKVDAAQPPALGSERERLSYALGVDVIAKLPRSGLVVDGEALARGVQDAAANRKLALSDEEIRKAVAQEQAKLRVRSRFGGRASSVTAQTSAPDTSVPDQSAHR